MAASIRFRRLAGALLIVATAGTLLACGTGDTTADDAPRTGPPQTLEDAAERYRNASFKVTLTLSGQESGGLTMTYARSTRGQQRFDLHGDQGSAVSFIVDGQAVTYCAPRDGEVVCRTKPPEGEGGFWVALLSAALGSLLDADALARSEQMDLLDVTGTHNETIAGRDATCFDLLVATDGEGDDTPPFQALTCFDEDGTPLRVGLPVDAGIMHITATHIEQPTDADFVPPAPVTH
jgi:hypothetical protein